MSTSNLTANTTANTATDILSAIASASVSALVGMRTIQSATDKVCVALAVDLVGQPLSVINAAIKQVKATITGRAPTQAFDRALLRCVVPTLNANSKAPVFLWNKDSGKKNSMALLHTTPKPLKASPNKKQLSAAGTAPLPSTDTAVTIAQLADALPSVSPLERIESELLAGVVTIKDLDLLLQKVSAALLSRAMASEKSKTERKAAMQSQTHNPAKIAAINADKVKEEKAA